MGTDTEKKLLSEMGQRAKARREELGLTINEVAVKMGRTYQCIHGMERDGILSMRVIIEWAHALGMNPQELAFGGEATQMAELQVKDGLLREAARLIDARRGRRKELVRLIKEELGE